MLIVNMLDKQFIKEIYSSDEESLTDAFISPMLSCSIEYWRGVGFFTSGWIRTVCNGIINLTKNGGKAFIVTSPNLNESDIESIKFGEEAKKSKIIHRKLSESIDDLREEIDTNTLNVLSWMISDEILNFKIAIPILNNNADYHDKIGVFIDEVGNKVVYHGSYNDSIQGSINGESFSVFKSWNEGQNIYAQTHYNKLYKLWNYGNKQFNVIEIPKAIKENLIKLKNNERPYNNSNYKNKSIFNNKIKLRDYQKEAIKNWKNENYMGLFEMATGTGKTITALSAANEIYIKDKKLVTLIIVPFLHLLEQWKLNCNLFGIEPLLCSGEHTGWDRKLLLKIEEYKFFKNEHLCIITVHKTSTSEKFIKYTNKIIEHNDCLLIADEAHGLGSKHLRRSLNTKIKYRLGLSATPKRWYDDEGTDYLINYFKCICFKFDLENAIESGFLTKYNYYPTLLELTEDEKEIYQQYTNQIKKIKGFKDKVTEDKIKKLLILRSKIINEAENKIPILINLLKEKIKTASLKNNEINHILIYCAPGQHKIIMKIVAELGLRCLDFVQDVNLKKRSELIERFTNGDIQVLIAIKCLDEGVDIPSTKIAYFLSSTTNPKEFIQRRGRILRLSPNKNKAELYDFLVVPNINDSINKSEIDIALLKREMPRFSEFSLLAANQFEARSKIIDLLDAFEMTNLFDKTPWDIYKESTIELKY